MHVRDRAAGGPVSVGMSELRQLWGVGKRRGLVVRTAAASADGVAVHTSQIDFCLVTSPGGSPSDAKRLAGPIRRPRWPIQVWSTENNAAQIDRFPTLFIYAKPRNVRNDPSVVLSKYPQPLSLFSAKFYARARERIEQRYTYWQFLLFNFKV